MSDELDDRFNKDLGAWVRTKVHENGEPLSETEGINAEIWDKCHTWWLGRQECQSPIEEIMLGKIIFVTDGYTDPWWASSPKELEECDFKTTFEMQAQIDKYRVDFLFTCRGGGLVRRLVVECDGHEFHEKTKEQARRDKSRDRFFVSKGIPCLRFTGSEIFRDADACKDEIESVLADVMTAVAEPLASGVFA
jgi:very-short-patch-repair endonuclease